MTLLKKTVYQTSSDGVYVGEAEADESPLEPGVFLIPAHCTELQPPSVPPGKRLKLVAGEWLLEDIPQSPPEPEPTHAELVEKVLSEGRVLRAELFKLADGLQASFLTLGNMDYALALETYKEGLRNATLTNLSGATTEAEMRAILGDVYDTLKGALPPAVKVKFYQTLQ